MKKNKKNQQIVFLLLSLFVVMIGGVLFVGAVSGWFSDPKIAIDEEYYRDGADFMELTSGEYEGLIEAKKSFIVFVDQVDCKTADRLRGFVTEYMTESGISVYRMKFSSAKESSLYEYVRYYPSVALISKGKVVGFLRADSDEDASAYNDYGAFKSWLQKYL